jgi:hypothetical protein
MVWLGIVLLGAFWLTMRGSTTPVSITVLPETPRQGEPLQVTFQLNNPGLTGTITGYKFYAGDKLIKEGQAPLAPLSSMSFQYTYPSPVNIGERISFRVQTSSNGKCAENTVSVPPFPPQVCSSFIAFASFSTTVMSSMATAPYYKGSFAGATTGLNTGLFISVFLILLLIFLELASAHSEDVQGEATGSALVLQRFRLQLGTLTWILLVIFIFMVFTKIILVLSAG